MLGELSPHRHCERSEAIQSLSTEGFWIASAFARASGQVASLAMTEHEASTSSSKYNCHSPRRRGIQYAAISRLNHNCLGVLDRPVKPGDDRECVAARLLVLAARSPELCFSHSTLKSKRAQGRPGADLAPAVCCARWCEETAQKHTGVANHSAFPAQWLDGLCRALPGAEFVLASLAFAEFTDAAPVDATAASAKA